MNCIRKFEINIWPSHINSILKMEQIFTVRSDSRHSSKTWTPSSGTESLLQWFSPRQSPLPQETFGNVWRYFQWSKMGGALVAVLVGKDQGCCCWTSCMHKAAPKQRSIQLKCQWCQNLAKGDRHHPILFSHLRDTYWIPSVPKMILRTRDYKEQIKKYFNLWVYIPAGEHAE